MVAKIAENGRVAKIAPKPWNSKPTISNLPTACHSYLNVHFNRINPSIRHQSSKLKRKQRKDCPTSFTPAELSPPHATLCIRRCRDSRAAAGSRPLGISARCQVGVTLKSSAHMQMTSSCWQSSLGGLLWFAWAPGVQLLFRCLWWAMADGLSTCHQLWLATGQERQ